jgi:transcriptional regulator with XRE-family HTH domain
MVDDVDFAALVKSLRVAKGLTQEEFAQALDVSVGTMNNWENGKHLPLKAQRKRLLRMARSMGLTIPPATRDMPASGARLSPRKGGRRWRS